jgi:hypothetical protein
MAIGYILWPFGTFYGNLVIQWQFGNLVAIWYIVSRKIWQPCFAQGKKDAFCFCGRSAIESSSVVVVVSSVTRRFVKKRPILSKYRPKGNLNKCEFLPKEITHCSKLGNLETKK